MSLSTLKKLFSTRKRKDGSSGSDEALHTFRDKYFCFKDLLAANAELLTIIADMEDKLQGREVFGTGYLLSQATRTVFHAGKMVNSFNRMSGDRYPVLSGILESLSSRIWEAIEQPKTEGDLPVVLPLAEVTRDAAHGVGGKSANLGDVRNRIGLPVPRGFAVTTTAYEAVAAANDLKRKSREILMKLAILDPDSVLDISRRIQALFDAAVIPEELEQAIFRALDALAAETLPANRPLRIAVRSSAVGEDSDLSFAGQYLSVLNVTREQAAAAYKSVLASLFSPRAVAYRLQKGIRDDDIAMGVAFLEMIPAKAAGVMYTRHPLDAANDRIVINAVWGLGARVVDGSAASDAYTVGRGPTGSFSDIERRIATKDFRLTALETGETVEEAVPVEDRRRCCLDEDQIRTLAGYGMKLEAHFGGPQDVEWALDPAGRLIVLQSRPLHVEREGDWSQARRRKAVAGYAVLLEAGDTACPGSGGGPVHRVGSDEDLVAFPQGGVLVANHSSPRYVIVLHKAAAVVTDFGSVTGHMASLTREFGVPALLNTENATAVLHNGDVVTVDAGAGRVYAGLVPKLLERRVARSAAMKGTPVYETLRKLADKIIPLNLVDPKSPEFRASRCRTVHDLMRLIHEFSYHEMFQLADRVSRYQTLAVKLDAPVPLDLHVIDLGGGMGRERRDRRKVAEKDIASAPFKALITGMLHEDLRRSEPRPVNMRGFWSVMSEQMLSPPRMGVDRFGDKSYAIVSDKYVNFSSRVGYHYSILDAYCGKRSNNNYVHFEFKGGAADDVRRNRRARLIRIVLERNGFIVEVTGDRVIARFDKHPGSEIVEKLDMLGRLLLFTRQLDMLMSSEETVDKLAACFLQGDYNLEHLVRENGVVKRPPGMSPGCFPTGRR
jgi:pyruvate,water dikinase